MSGFLAGFFGKRSTNQTAKPEAPTVHLDVLINQYVSSWTALDNQLTSLNEEQEKAKQVYQAAQDARDRSKVALQTTHRRVLDAEAACTNFRQELSIKQAAVAELSGRVAAQRQALAAAENSLTEERAKFKAECDAMLQNIMAARQQKQHA